MSDPLVSVRAIGAADRPALEAMASRCTRRSLLHRFHAPLAAMPRSYVDAVTDGNDAIMSVGAFVEDAVVGVASLHPVGPNTVEIGVLVEDAWQHRGVGRRMVNWLIDAARARDVASVQAQILTSQARIVSMLRPHGRVAVREQGITSDLVLTLRQPA